MIGDELEIAENADICTVVGYFRNEVICQIEFPKFDALGPGFVLSGLLGKGKTSEVFLVQKDNDFYALKVAIPGFEWAIKQEWKILKQLNCDSFQKGLWHGYVAFQDSQRFSLLLSPVRGP